MIAAERANTYDIREPSEVEQLGVLRYEADVKRVVEPQRNGEFIALDVDSGDFCVNDDELSALRGLRQRQPNARIYFARVGASVVYEMRRVSLTTLAQSQ